MTSSAPTVWARAGANLTLAGQALRWWTARQVLVAVVAGLAVAVMVGVATVLIPNQVFARDIPPVWWNYPVWLLTSALSGMLISTYLRTPADAARRTGRSAATSDAAQDDDGDLGRTSRMGMVGGMLAWFAVGCPVCNKIALLALGYSGAITWFAPLQPLLAGGALILTGVALVSRLRGQVACPVRPAALVAAL